ncbi:hypothetical protein ACFC1R_06610 [Kitasatospora sp. NPDC056138]|uniref:hypothetical protein n=1 Tax=Kitasatospora sp. NPDC056138 TaxID=3345724 RepID=UPI0035DC66CD
MTILQHDVSGRDLAITRAAVELYLVRQAERLQVGGTEDELRDWEVRGWELRAGDRLTDAEVQGVVERAAHVPLGGDGWPKCDVLLFDADAFADPSDGPDTLGAVCRALTAAGYQLNGPGEWALS